MCTLSCFLELNSILPERGGDVSVSLQQSGSELNYRYFCLYDKSMAVFYS